MIKQVIGVAAASALLIGGFAIAATTGNDNGHGDHGCHVGEQNNDIIINPHCPSPSASPSGSPKASNTPSPSVTPSPTPTPKASTLTTATLPDTGGHGHLR